MRVARRVSGRFVVLIAVFCVTLLVAAQAFAADASSNWYEASGPVASGATQSGAISPAGDVDWYCFYNDVPSGVTAGAVRIGINRATGSDDGSSLALYRWDGGKLVYVDDLSTGSSTPIDSALKSGLYYVKIVGSFSSAAGSYDFTVTGDYVKTSLSSTSKVQAKPVAVSVAAEDWKNQWWQAIGPLEPTRPHVSQIDSAGDVDWYCFYNDVPSGVTAGAVRIGINRATGSDDGSSLALYRWDGGKLVYVDDLSTGSSTPIDSALKSGLYYVKIVGSFSSAAGSYDFTVAGKYVTASHPYLSSVAGNSSAIRRGTTYAFSGRVLPATAVSLEVARHNSSSRTYVAYASVPAVLSASGSPRKFTAKWKPTAAGTYRLRWLTSGPAGMRARTSASRYVRVK